MVKRVSLPLVFEAALGHMSGFAFPTLNIYGKKKCMLKIADQDLSVSISSHTSTPEVKRKSRQFVEYNFQARTLDFAWYYGCFAKHSLCLTKGSPF